MRVLFFYPEINVPVNASALLDMGRYAAALRTAGVEARLAWLRHLPSEQDWAAFLGESRPHLLVAFIQPGQLGAAKPYLFLARKHLPQLIVIAGGLLPGLSPDEVVNLPGVDALALGEAEAALVEFVLAWQRGGNLDDIDNFWLKTTQGEILRRPLRPLNDDLDAVPPPDPEFVPYQALLRANGGLLPVRAGRGCGPTEHAAVNLMYRKKAPISCRHRRPECIVAEVIERFNPELVSAVQFVDEAFPSEAQWLARFCENWSAKVKLPFRIRAQVKALTGAALELLRGAGCEQVVIELTAGLPVSRTPAGGSENDFTERDLAARLAQIKSSGMALGVELIMGHPQADPTRIENTLVLVREADPAAMSVRLFDPLPGSELWHECRRGGMLSDRERFSIMPYRSTLRLPNLSEDELLQKFERAHLACSTHAAGRLKRLDEREGYFDVLQNFEKARVRARNRTLAGVGEFAMEKQQRPVLWQTAGSEVIFDAPLRPNSHLCFGMALEPDAGQMPAQELFNFEIELRQGENSTLVFHKLLPSGEALRWFDYSLPLSDAQPGPARLIFRLQIAGGAEYSLRRGYWSRPFLTDRSTLAARGQKSSTADITAGAIAIQRTLIERLERELDEAGRNQRLLETQVDALRKQLERRDEENEELRRRLNTAAEAIARLQAQLIEALPLVEKHNKSFAARLKKLLRK
ncbi:MAG: hypothetical protein Kow0059_20110 [Candidatus Sumerlaeia bacterium]